MAASSTVSTSSAVAAEKAIDMIGPRRTGPFSQIHIVSIGHTGSSLAKVVAVTSGCVERALTVRAGGCGSSVPRATGIIGGTSSVVAAFIVVLGTSWFKGSVSHACLTVSRAKRV